MLFGSGSQASSIWRLVITWIGRLIGGLGWSPRNCFSNRFLVDIDAACLTRTPENCFRTMLTSRQLLALRFQSVDYQQLTFMNGDNNERFIRCPKSKIVSRKFDFFFSNQFMKVKLLEISSVDSESFALLVLLN